MIHLLQVDPKMTIQEMRKLARRYAMTGGFEIGLANDLSSEDLIALTERHVPELGHYQKDSSRYRSNNSYRVLTLIFAHPLASEELKDKIRPVL